MPHPRQITPASKICAKPCVKLFTAKSQHNIITYSMLLSHLLAQTHKLFSCNEEIILMKLHSLVNVCESQSRPSVCGYNVNTCTTHSMEISAFLETNTTTLASQPSGLSDVVYLQKLAGFPMLIMATPVNPRSWNPMTQHKGSYLKEPH